jgi:spermidine/putrescine transport system substrate-binding protein
MSLTRRDFLKRSAAIALGAPLLSSCTGTAGGAGSSKRLNIFSWADYVAPDTVSNFEKQFGIEVTYDTFASNETLLARLEAGSVEYDIIVPTNYVISKMIRAKILQPLDHARLPNYKYMMERFRHLSYDPGNQYAIPYTFGTTGIAYNKDAFRAAGQAGPTDWDSFWDPRFSGRMTLLEDARETIGFALKRKGHSYNSVDAAQITAACHDLESQKKYVMCYTSDQVIVYLSSGDAQLSLAFSGDAHIAARSNDSVGYIIPASGSSMWFDNMCIPASAPHVESAYKWINYILEPQVGADLTNYTYFPVPNIAAAALIKPELRDDKTLYLPEAVMDKCDEISDIGDGIFLYDRAWTELKCV